MGFEKPTNSQAAIEAKRKELEELRAKRDGLENSETGATSEREENFSVDSSGFEESILDENPVKISDFNEITFTTQSRNQYTLKKLPTGEYSLFSARDKKEVIIDAPTVNELTIQCGRSFRYGGVNKTSTVDFAVGLVLKK